MAMRRNAMGSRHWSPSKSKYYKNDVFSSEQLETTWYLHRLFEATILHIFRLLDFLIYKDFSNNVFCEENYLD